VAGVIGTYAGEVMVALFSARGAAILCGVTLVIAGTYLSGHSLTTLVRLAGRGLAFVAARSWAGMRAAASSIAGRFASRAMEAAPAATAEPAAEAPAEAHDTRVEVPRFAEPDPTPPIVFSPRWAEPTRATTVTDSGTMPTRSTGMAALDARVADVSVATGIGVPAAPAAADAATAAGSTGVTNEPRIVVNPRKTRAVQESLALAKRSSGPWEPPALALLDFVPAANTVVDRDALRRKAETLEKKLQNYKVEGRVVEIHPGPVVTMFEFLPAEGVKISQIANLADDLTMALEATSIRIVAPIPGKGVVGIEVPNSVRETVYLREILSSEEFGRAKSKLTLALGKDIFGNPQVTDLAKMPHLLIAGATGSGKSVAVNAFILSLLYNASPEDVRMILVDPKVVELQVYEGIPHLLLPVVYDPKHAAAALRWAVEEMERRYELLARAGTRNLQSYNQRVDRMRAAAGNPGAVSDTEPNAGARTDSTETEPEEWERLPYIVIILDEFADLMMVASKDVETAVARLAQKARAAGIHLVMATQRPSKEVITGLIKANFPSRIAFRVSSKIDSRIILDQSGADALLGYGDLLFLRPGSSLVTRVHGPFVSEEEVHRVVEHVKRQGQPEYQMDILSSAASSDEDEDDAEADDLLEQARTIVVETRRASISFLQRKLTIGYNRSARIMEQLERRGVVGPPNSRGERQVLV
jgi:S-DNA-T family DNA segregation ATPase FtsK/SpoIIIE